ncbi:hypothetical protein GC101_21285 [Paenibacillus sp. LMG 31459]|uniref:Spore protein n=1 Tax=Paenibacillus phytohabitans TaxID=2654978 RepID=A0ABX1YM39_9BACL|nr:hypothetical protein [Paenibacillus phytohabitans]NOU81399.1 hypothetical protein [Paenibacillus phytohabitans]
MRKTEFNVRPRKQMSRMYAKNRIQCASESVDEPNVWEKPSTIKGINPSESAESGRHEEIKGKNPSNSAKSGRHGEIKGINPFESAESERHGEIKGKNPSEPAQSGQ